MPTAEDWTDLETGPELTPAEAEAARQLNALDQITERGEYCADAPPLTLFEGVS